MRWLGSPALLNKRERRPTWGRTFRPRHETYASRIFSLAAREQREDGGVDVAGSDGELSSDSISTIGDAGGTRHQTLGGP